MGDDGEEEQRAWEEARRREVLASDLLKRHPKRLTIKAVEAAAWELGLSRATMYRVTDRYRSMRAVSGLLPRTWGRRKGFRILTAEQEAVIQGVARREYLKPTRAPLSHLVEHVQ